MFGNSKLARQTQEPDNPFDPDAIQQEPLLENPFGQAIPGSGERETQGVNPFDVPPEPEPASSDPLPGEREEKPEKLDPFSAEEPVDIQPFQESENNGQPFQESENNGGMPRLPSEQHEAPLFDVPAGKQSSSEKESTKVSQSDAPAKVFDVSNTELLIWYYLLPIAIIFLGVVFKRWLVARKLKAQGFAKPKKRFLKAKKGKREVESFHVGNSLKSRPDKPSPQTVKNNSNKNNTESQTELAPAFSDALINFSDSAVLNQEDLSDLQTSDETPRTPVKEPETVTASRADIRNASQFNLSPNTEIEESIIVVSGATVIHVGAKVSESGTINLGQLAGVQGSVPDTDLNNDDSGFSKESEEAEGVEHQPDAVNGFSILGSDESPSQLEKNNVAIEVSNKFDASIGSESTNDDSAIFDSGELEFDLSEGEEELDLEMEIEDAFDMETKATKMGDGLAGDLDSDTVLVDTQVEHKNQIELPAANVAAATAGAAIVADVSEKIGGGNSDARIRELELELSKWKENAAKFESEASQLAETLKKFEQDAESEARRAEELEKQKEGLTATETELVEFKSKLEMMEQSLKDARAETQAELDKNKCEIAELKSKLATTEQSLKKNSEAPQAELVERDAEVAELKLKLATAEQSLKKKNEAPQAELVERDAEIAELKSKLATAEQSLKKKNEALQAELVERDAEIAELKLKLETAEQSLAKASEAPQVELVEKDAEISELRSKLEMAEQSLKDSKEETQAALDKREAENAELKSKLETTEQSLKNANEETRTALAKNESKASELESKLAAACQQVEAAKAEQAELKSQLETATAKLENCEEDSSLAEELARSKKELADALGKKKALKSKLKRLLGKFEKQKIKQVKVDSDETGVLVKGPSK